MSKKHSWGPKNLSFLVRNDYIFNLHMSLDYDKKKDKEETKPKESDNLVRNLTSKMNCDDEKI